MSDQTDDALRAETLALRELAVTDPLTGIGNRRSFDERLAGEWQRSARAGTPLALVMVDVDHFKAFNDAYGHVAGDECLQKVAAALSACSKRPGDHVARYGGEEFAAILPGTDERGAAVLAEAMRCALAAAAIPHRTSSLGVVSASFGVAALMPNAGQPPVELVRAADAALYEAKAGGRNRVVGERVGSGGQPARHESETPHNLPEPGQRLIGRAAEFTRIVDFFRDARASVVTLTGGGGVGKTRLALEAAHTLRAAFADGVWFVDLAALGPHAAAEHIAEAVASAMALRARPGRPALESVREALAGRRVLFVLDTAEHVRGSVRDFIAAVRASAPEAGFLVTSRVALRLHGEHTERIEPLTEAAGIELFVARALDAVPALRSSADLNAVAADIVRRVDRLPLAIELAAARLNVLSPGELATHLESHVRVLRGRGRNARHETLTALLDWSYTLLEKAEQELFVRLAIFAGGWTLESAHAVCGSGESEPLDVLEHLTALVEASLVVADHHDGKKRFRFLETTLAYARHRLAASGERYALAERHAAFIAAFGHRSRALIVTSSGADHAAEADLEADNIRAAVEWAFARPDRAPLAARLCVALVYFWSRRFFDIPAAIAWTERAIASIDAQDGADPQLAADLTHALGHLLTLVGQGTRVRPLAMRALEHYRAQGDDAGAARALTLIGHGLMQAPHDLDAAEQIYEEARELARRSNELRALGLAGRGLGRIATERQDYERAEQVLTATVAVYRRMNDPVGTGVVLGSLAYCAYARAEYQLAVTRAREAHALLEGTRADFDLAWNLMNLATFELEAGDPAAARQLARRAIGMWIKGRHETFVHDCFETLSRVALLEGAAAHAVALFGFSSRGAFDGPHTGPEQRAFRAHLDALRAAAGARFDAAWREGAGWSLAEALAAEGSG